MKTNLKKLSLKLFTCVISALCIFLTGNAVTVNSLASGIHGHTYYATNSSASVTNGEFTSHKSASSTSGTKQPYSVDGGWTANVSSNVMHGVIDVSSSFKSGDYGFTSVPQKDEGQTDDKMLMLKALSANVTGTYTSDKNISLPAKSFYELVIHANAINSSAKVTAKVDDQGRSFDINTSGWRTYYFLIATDEYNASNLSISLNFSSTTANGMAFFDGVTLKEISHDDFYYEKNSTTANLTTIDLTRPQLTTFTNSDFENNNGFEFSVTGATSAPLSAIKTDDEITGLVKNITGNTSKKYGESFVYNSDKALVLISNDDTPVYAKTTADNLLTISQHGLYEISFLYQTNTSDGFKVVVLPTNTDTTETSLTLAKNDGLKAYNGFNLARIYVKGNAIQDETIGLKFEITGAQNYAVIDHITVRKVTTKETASGDAKIICDLSTVTKKDTKNIANRNFDFVEYETLDQSFPLKPTSWTLTTNNTNLKNGVVKLRNFESDATTYGYPTSVNPNYNDKTYGAYGMNSQENMLLVQSEVGHKSYFTSPSVTVTASSNTKTNSVKFTVGVKVPQGKAYIQLVDNSGNVLCTYSNIANRDWQNYDLYYTNGIADSTLKLILGTEDDSFAFFDAIDYQTDLTLTGNEGMADRTALCDMLNNKFTSRTTDITNSLYGGATFSMYQQEGTFDFGLTAVGKGNYLKLINDGDVGYASLSTNYTYKLVKNNYYKLAVTLRSNASTNISLVPLDEGEIVIEENNKNVLNNLTANEFTTYYMFLICKDATEAKVLLGLGTSENKVSGWAEFESVSLTQISEDDYRNAQDDEEYTTSNSVFSEALPAVKKSSDNNSTSTQQGETNIWLLASSIMLVMAMVLALAGYLMRRLPKKPSKKSKVARADYAEAPKKKVNVREVENELQTKLASDLEKLNDKIDEVKNEIKELNDNYKAQDGEGTSKEYVEYVKKLNKLNERLNYLQSAKAYLLSDENVKDTQKREVKNRQQKIDKENK